MEDMMNTTEVMDTVENEEVTDMVPCDSTTCEDEESSVGLGGLAIVGLAFIGAVWLTKKGIGAGKKFWNRRQEKKAKTETDSIVETEAIEVEVVEENTTEKKENLKK